MATHRCYHHCLGHEKPGQQRDGAKEKAADLNPGLSPNSPVYTSCCSSVETGREGKGQTCQE